MRPHFGALHIAASMLFASILAAHAASPSDPTAISVDLATTDTGAYHVSGQFEVGAGNRLAWQVLTDYERMPEFLSGIHVSRIVARDGRGFVEQIGKGRIFIFSRTIHLLLDVQEKFPSEIVFEDILEESFIVYRGRWSLEECAGISIIRYTLEARPAFWAPAGPLKSGLRRMVQELLGEVQAEIIRRSKESP